MDESPDKLAALAGVRHPSGEPVQIVFDPDFATRAGKARMVR